MRLAMHSSSMPAARHRQRHGGLLLGGLLAGLLCAPPGTAFAQAGPRVHAVSMEAVRFSPAVLQVRLGDTIQWRNADSFPHNVTARDGGFRSGDIGPGQSWNFRAGTKGRFPYACTLHPGMEAVLVVE